MSQAKQRAGARRGRRGAKKAAVDADKAPQAASRPSDGRAKAPLPAAANAVEARPDEPLVPENAYRVEIASAGFEGPLDLLLHLIQKHELDILDIPVGFITERYLEYLSVMQSLTIDLASEYLVMAATLTHIKSKMLLPEVPSGQDDAAGSEEELDPREELMRRLLEYQKYKAAGEALSERGTLGRDVFPRGITEPVEQGPAPFAETNVFALLDAFDKILKRTKVEIDHEVVFDRISITDRIVELTEVVSERRAVTFEGLFKDVKKLTRFDLVITFLAVLEMARLKLVRVYQAEPVGPIYLELSSLAPGEGVAAVEAEGRAAATFAPAPTAEPAPAPTSEPAVEPAPAPTSEPEVELSAEQESPVEPEEAEGADAEETVPTEEPSFVPEIDENPPAME